MNTNFENVESRISVEEFVSIVPADLEIEVIAGEKGLKLRTISSSRIQKLGLALAGYSQHTHQGRIQIVGQSEIGYLSHLDSKARASAIEQINLANISCILVTKSLEPPIELLEIANKIGLPILRTPVVSSLAINSVTSFLQEVLAPQITLHAVFMGIYGLGVLILGASGVGKSECALDLVTRGHRLIADDAVLVKKIGENLLGSSPELTHELLEIRGLGIINIKELFGVSAVGNQSSVDLCVELKRWNDVKEIDRLGVETNVEEIFGVKVVKFVLPVSSGRNISTLVETAIRIHLLKAKGYDAAQNLIEKHTQQMQAGSEK